MAWANRVFRDVTEKQLREYMCQLERAEAERSHVGKRETDTVNPGSFVSGTYSRAATTGKQEENLCGVQGADAWRSTRAMRQQLIWNVEKRNQRPKLPQILAAVYVQDTCVLTDTCLPMLWHETHSNLMSRPKYLRQTFTQIRKRFWHGYFIEVFNFLNEIYSFEHCFSHCIKGIFKN